MTNLIFDLNNIAHRSMFIVGGYGAKQFTFDSEKEIDQLMRKMAMDIAFIVRIVNPSRILFAKDDSSWRKDIEIEENEGYKGNRVKAAHINWKNVYEALGEFCEIMKNNGLVVTQIPKAEADDVIALWAEELMKNQNQHVIIVSGDEDLRQLVGSYNKTGNVSFTTVFNPFMQGKNAFRKLYVPYDFENWLNTSEPVDFMHIQATMNVDKEDFHKIISTERTKMEVVDGRMIYLRKMFCGDGGDNIPSIYSWLNDKGVEVRITNSKFEKIYEALLASPEELINYSTLLERAPKVLEIIEKTSKKRLPFDNEMMYARILRQARLVVLNHNLFPVEIVATFDKNKQAEIDKPRVNYANLNMHNILEGTRYVTNKKNESEAAIFHQIDRIHGKSLF
jgi:5'-3' exonuclease, N-terminal resolvase-like domain